MQTVTIWNSIFFEVMLTDIFRMELEKLPIEFMTFNEHLDINKMIRREIRPRLSQLAEMPIARILDHLIAPRHPNLKTKTPDSCGSRQQEEGCGYDSELTADLTSDDTAGEEELQISQANTNYKFAWRLHLQGTSARMDLESLQGCYTGVINGSFQAREAVENLEKISLYRESMAPKF